MFSVLRRAAAAATAVGLVSLSSRRLAAECWDSNWDHRSETDDTKKSDVKRRRGPKRHLIFIRHGQYVETEGDENRILTPIGREQAEETGRRLSTLIGEMGMNVKCVRVSTMARAKETASIIFKHLHKDFEEIKMEVPDPNLDEGVPYETLPWKWAQSKPVKLHQDSVRIETAFRRYFYRSSPVPLVPLRLKEKEQKQKQEQEQEVEEDQAVVRFDAAAAAAALKKSNDEKHEFEIIVCHGNVIRFFFMRALQLPPEAWLRLSLCNCSLSYFTINPNGAVACRMLGDVGHLGTKHITNGESRQGFVN